MKSLMNRDKHARGRANSIDFFFFTLSWHRLQIRASGKLSGDFHSINPNNSTTILIRGIGRLSSNQLSVFCNSVMQLSAIQFCCRYFQLRCCRKLSFCRYILKPDRFSETCQVSTGFR